MDEKLFRKLHDRLEHLDKLINDANRANRAVYNSIASLRNFINDEYIMSDVSIADAQKAEDERFLNKMANVFTKLAMGR